MYDIYNILEGIYEDEELRYTCIPLFRGNPGIAKSILVQKFADDKGVQLVEMIGSTLDPREVTGISIPNQETQMMSYFDYDRLLKLKDGDIIFFDEILNTNTMVLNACLTLLQNRTMTSGRKLPKVMIVAAANKQGATVLTPQIKERFIFYDVEFKEKSWAEYMYNKYNIIDEVLEDLITLIKNEKFESSRENYYSSRSIDKALSMIIRGVETPYEKDLNPILKKYMINTTGKTIEIGDLEWLPDEKISWLKFAKAQYKLSKMKKDDKVNTEFQTEVTDCIPG